MATASLSLNQDQYASSMDVNSGFMLLGVHSNEGGEYSKGVVYAFPQISISSLNAQESVAALWSSLSVAQTILSPNAGDGSTDNFGCSVEVKGDMAMIGASEFSDTFQSEGVVYVYAYDPEMARYTAQTNSLSSSIQRK